MVAVKTKNQDFFVKCLQRKLKHFIIFKKLIFFAMYHFLVNMLSSEPVPIFLQQYLGRPDVRVKDWILLNSPFNLVAVYFTYAAVILGGTKIMQNRNPLQLKNALIVYNFCQIVFTAYICKEVCFTAYMTGFTMTCTPLDMSRSKEALRMAKAFWYFYVSKIVDLTDTVFFVLRKKSSQLTFLHIYHHASMICNWYIGVLYVPGGQACVSVAVNSFVHVIMYTYYLLSAMGPKMQKYLWWKKYLTQIQLIQFVVVMIHIVIGCVNGCNKPFWLACFTIVYLWTLVLLFVNFYIHTYKYRKPKTFAPELTSTPQSKSPKRSNVDVKAGGDMKLD